MRSVASFRLAISAVLAAMTAGCGTTATPVIPPPGAAPVIPPEIREALRKARSRPLSFVLVRGSSGILHPWTEIETGHGSILILEPWAEPGPATHRGFARFARETGRALPAGYREDDEPARLTRQEALDYERWAFKSWHPEESIEAGR
jgi:hypothetical protein